MRSWVVLSAGVSAAGGMRSWVVSSARGGIRSWVVSSAGTSFAVRRRAGCCGSARFGRSSPSCGLATAGSGAWTAQGMRDTRSMPCLGHDCVSLRTSELRARVDAAATYAAASPLPDLAARRGPPKLSASNTIASISDQTKKLRGQLNPPAHPGRPPSAPGFGSHPPDTGTARGDRTTGRPRSPTTAGRLRLTCEHASLRVPLPDLRRHLRTEPPDGGVRRPRGLPRRARRHGEAPVDGLRRHGRLGVRPGPGATLRRGRRRLLRRGLLRLNPEDFSGTLQSFPGPLAGRSRAPTSQA